ncbi:PLP-dependent aminotransferase family protein [Hoeflea sp. CAU 1731]
MSDAALLARAPRLARRASRMQASEIRELLKIIEQPGVISFAGGIPDPALFPVDAIRQHYSDILSDPASAGKALQYSVSEGDADLRDRIVDHMRARGVRCDRDNILITSGSQQALEFTAKLFLSPGDTALVTAPTYLGALQAFAASEPVFQDLDMADIEATAAQFHAHAQSEPSDCKIAYVVPDFANPSGKTMDLAARRRLLDLAETLDIAIIEDSPYAALRYEGEPVAPIQALDLENGRTIDESRVVFCGSFSKVFTPGLRLGWVCASRDLIRRLVLIKQSSDLNAPALNQMVVARLMADHFDRQAARAQAHYRTKRDAMLEALSQHMPAHARWSEPEGGMFIWLSAGDGIDTAALLPRAIGQARVAYVPGRAFYADGRTSDAMRLSFSLPDCGQIRTGVERLAGIVRQAG